MTQLSEENSQKTQETSEQKETIRVGIYMIGVCFYFKNTEHW